jgi:hypothetical protein
MKEQKVQFCLDHPDIPSLYTLQFEELGHFILEEY